MTRTFLKSISDDELLSRLSGLVQQSRRIESELVAHIAEVDARRLYARESFPSMFAYCTEKLNLSEHEAYLRITVGRASREHPGILEMLGDGRLHLSGVAKLVPHLTVANRDDVLGRAAYKSKRKVEELVAEISPKPDVPAIVRKLPQRTPRPEPVIELGPDRVTDLPTPAKAKPALVQPLAPASYKVQFTANSGFHAKLERLQSLQPGSDLAALLEEAVTEKLERLEAKRFGKTKAPKKNVEETDTSPSSRYIPAPVRREVSERDGNQCTFVDPSGRRCKSQERLEFHHKNPFARGGDHSPENIQLMCKAHNQYLAKRVYGRETMERYFAREPAAVYLSHSSAIRVPSPPGAQMTNALHGGPSALTRWITSSGGRT